MGMLRHLARHRYVVAALLALAVLPRAARADGSGPPYDFADAYYQQNGIDPGKILMRVDGTPPVSILDATAPPDHRGVRVLDTTGGFDASGNLLYYNIYGMFTPNAFTADDAGRNALAIANSYRAFVLPKRSGAPLSPALGNRRQDNVFDTRNGYFSNNPLGLWLLTFVSYTDKALNTPDGQTALANLRAKNGSDLDGTPIIRSASDIDGLAQNGLVLLQTRAQDGSQGFPWVL